MRIVLDKRLPLALAAGFALQVGAALWWVADQSSLLRYQQQRLQVLEAQQALETRDTNATLVRLARIEERLVAQAELLREIRTRVEK